MENNDNLAPIPPYSAAAVGLKDLSLDGWCNTTKSEFVPGISVGPGMSVVDVGCGYGGHIEFCASMGADVTFLDVQEEKIRDLESRLSRLEQGSSTGIVSGCDPIPLPDGSADLVICTEVLEHVKDPAALIREIVRIGKANATFVLTVPDSRGEYLIKDVAPPDYFKEPNHIRIFTSEDFRELVDRNGLDIQRMDYRGSFWTIFYLFKWVTSEAGEKISEAVHPITKLWTQTWAEVLNHPEGERIVKAMNAALPKMQVIIARKK